MDFPFIKKGICISKQGKCKYWNSIQLGYMRDDEGRPTPILESRTPDRISTPWCSYIKGNIEVLPNRKSCFYEEKRLMNDDEIADTCGECDYFNESDHGRCYYKKSLREVNSNEPNCFYEDDREQKGEIIEDNCGNCQYYHQSRGTCNYPTGEQAFPGGRCTHASSIRAEGNTVPVECGNACPHFISSYTWEDPSTPYVCAYATIIRHLMESTYEDDSGSVIFDRLNQLPAEKIRELEEIGYGVVREGGNVTKVVLKMYDILMLTYQKMNALFRASAIGTKKDWHSISID